MPYSRLPGKNPSSLDPCRPKGARGAAWTEKSYLPRNCVESVADLLRVATMTGNSLSGQIGATHSEGGSEIQAALPAAETAAFTDSAEGSSPLPLSSHSKATPVQLENASRVAVSGTRSGSASIAAIVARESPARRPSSAAESSEISRTWATRSEIVSTATDIATSTDVVKYLPLAAITVAGQDPGVRTLADRIVWIQANSGPKKLSVAEVAKRGGMTRQGLSRLMRASRKDPSKKLGLGETMEALATGNNVDLTWLMTGRGVPRKGKLSARDMVLNEREWPEQARAAVLADGRELSTEQWRAMLNGIEAVLGGHAASSKKPGKPRSN